MEQKSFTLGETIAASILILVIFLLIAWLEGHQNLFY